MEKKVAGDWPNSPTEQARRELENMLDLYHIFRDGKSIPFRKCTELECVGLEEALVAWHLRHAPQPPSREEIIKVLKDYKVDEGKYCASPVAIASEILALFRPASLGQGSEPKVWCNHCIFRSGGVGDGPHPVWYVFNGTSKEIPADWDICPVAGCHAPRPKPEGGDGS